MKKILIGTHNEGKFIEISHLIAKKIKKISPVKLKIKSPKETGKTFKANAKIDSKTFYHFYSWFYFSSDFFDFEFSIELENRSSKKYF